VELARPVDVEPAEQPGPLTTLRIERELTVEEAAERTELWRRLSGIPAGPPRRRRVGRRLAACAAAGLVAAVAVALGLDSAGSTKPARPRAATLPPPWKVAVDVLNGSGNVVYTHRMASRVGSFGYRIEHVTRANRSDYRQTAVYFEPGGAALARRLAGQIGVPTRPLPGGTNPHRLVVVVGPPHGTG
jgi:hypothetical protein